MSLLTLDLDEYSEEALRAELVRRREARARLVCDYCGREAGTRPCKFPDRHSAEYIVRDHPGSLPHAD
jgi:hypothetical protein